MFKTIRSIDDIKTAVADVKEIRFATLPNGVTVGCYMFMDSKTFEVPEALECRGIAFDQNGELASRPLHKFFNLGEKASLTRESLLAREANGEVAAIFEKVDGSMIATAIVNGALHFRSKKVFDSPVVIARFLSRHNASEKIEFNPDWANGIDGLANAVNGNNAPAIPAGEVRASIDRSGRKILLIGTRFGNVLIFMRYSDEGCQTITNNVPDQIVRFMADQMESSENLCAAEDVAMFLIGSEFVNTNIGKRLEEFFQN